MEGARGPQAPSFPPKPSQEPETKDTKAGEEAAPSPHACPRAPGGHGFRLAASLLSRDDRDVLVAEDDAMQLRSTLPKPAPMASSPASLAAGSCGAAPMPDARFVHKCVNGFVRPKLFS